jgi:PAS domain S-box-containing protein
LIGIGFENHLWMKSIRGCEIEMIALNSSLFQQTFQEPKKALIFEDINKVQQSQNLQLEKPFPPIRFYAGFPLLDSKGLTLGVLSVMDRNPHKLSKSQTRSLQTLADRAAKLLEFEKDDPQSEFNRRKIGLEAQQLDNIVDAAQVGTWEWNVQTGEVIFNERWAEIAGYTLEELKPISIDTWTKLVHPQDLNISKTQLNDCFERKIQLYNIECRIIHKEGHYVWINSRGRVAKWSTDGKPLYMVGTHTDISAQKNAEIQLKTITDNIPGVVFRYKRFADGRDELHLVSKGAANLWGISAKEAMLNNQMVWDNYHQDDLAAHRDTILKSAEDMSHWEHEWRYNHPDGTLRWHKGYGNPTRLEDGSTIWDSLILDITEEKLTKIVLQETENRFYYLFDNVTNLSVQGYTADGNVKFWNEASEKLYGYTKAEAMGKKLWDLIIPEEMKINVQAAVKEMITSGKGHPAEELTLKRKNGSLVSVFSNHTVVTIPGKDPELFCIDIDLTPVQVVNSELNHALNELNERIKEQACLFKIANLAGEDVNINDLLEKSVEIIPEGLTYVEFSKASIAYNGSVYQSVKHKKTQWALTAQRTTSEGNSLEVQVCYSRNLPPKDEGPFCKEERLLLESIANNLVMSIDRISAKKKIEASERRFKNLVQEGADLISVLDMKGNYTYLSPNFFHHLGYEPEKKIGKNAFDFVHPDDRERLLQEFNKLQTEKRVKSLPYRFRHKDGTWKWFQSIGTNLLEDEALKGIVFNTIDVTESINAERQLQISEKRFRSLVENSLDAIAIIGLDGNASYVSPSISNVLGYSEEEALQLNLFQIVHPDDIQGVVKRMEVVLNHPGETIEGYTSRTQHKDGSWRWLEASITNLLHDPNINGIVDNFRDVTFRIESENILKASEEKYRILFNSTPIPKLIYEIQSSLIMDVNKAAEEHYGYSHGEFLEMTIDMLRSQENGGAIDHTKEKIVERSNYIRFGIFRHQKKNGKQINVEIVGHQVNFQEKECMMIVCNDVTETIKAQQDLKRSFEEKTLILESIGDGFFTLDNKWIVTYWNKQAELITKIKREDIMGKCLWEIFPEITNTQFYHQYHLAKQTQLTSVFEEYYPSLNIWMEISAYPSKEGLTVFFKDITLRRMAEEQIKLSNDRFEKVSEATNDAIWDWDIENDTLFWGGGFKSLFGYDVEKITPTLQTWTEHIHPEDLYTVESSINSALEIPENNNWISEYRYLKMNGEFAYVVDRGIIIRNNEGKAIRMVGAMTDITYRKEYEESLKDLNLSLEKYTKDLEISNLELEQFAFVASHDLQEPLRMVSSFLNQLERKYGDLLDEKAKQYIHFASDGARRMKQIILDLLEFSKAGKPEEDMEHLDLNELMEDYKILRRKLIQDKSAIISYDKLPVIMAFRAGILQSLYNILDNSLKYCKPNEPPQITIFVEDRGKWWKFEIMDNGIGIAKEYYEKIFTIFQRLHNRDDYSGTGIGLAIVKKNIESLGGEIWLESELGKGSTFHFILPKRTSE